MAVGFVLAKTADADRLKKSDGGKKFDDLSTFRGLHLTLVTTAKDRKVDLAVFVLRNKVRSRSDQRQPEIKVILTLPILAPDAPWHMPGHAQSKTLTRLATGTIPVSRKKCFHARWGPTNCRR